MASWLLYLVSQPLVLQLHYLWALWEGLWENGDLKVPLSSMNSSDQEHDATVNWKDVMWVDVMYSTSSDTPYNVNNIPSQWPWLCLVGFLDQNPFLLVLTQKWKYYLLTLIWFQSFTVCCYLSVHTRGEFVKIFSAVNAVEYPRHQMWLVCLSSWLKSDVSKNKSWTYFISANNISHFHLVYLDVLKYLKLKLK